MQIFKTHLHDGSRDYSWDPGVVDPALDPATRVVDSLGREWAVHTNGHWAALGESLSVDNYEQLVGSYGPCEVLG